MHVIGRRTLLSFGVALCCDAVAPRLAAADSPLIRMAYFEDFRPYSYRLPDGAMTGLFVATADLLAERCGFKVGHFGYPWGRAQAMVKADELDGFCTVATEQRLAYAEFCATPLVVTRFGIFHRQDDSRPTKAGSAQDLVGLRQGSYIGNGWALKNLQGQRISWESTEERVLKMIAAKRLDIYIGAELPTWQSLKEIGLADKFHFTAVEFYPPAIFAFALRRSFPEEARLVAAMDSALKIARSDGTLGRLERAFNLPA